MIKTFEQYYQIYEGLIKSVDLNKMMELLKRNFPEYEIDKANNNSIRIVDKYCYHHTYIQHKEPVDLDESKIKPLDVQKIKKFAELLGWFISIAKSKRKVVLLKTVNNAEYTRDVINGKIKDKIMIVYLERKYENKLSIKRDKLYHITDDKYIEKIKRNGLIPKYAGKRTIHPERIYLCEKISVPGLVHTFKRYLKNPYVLEINMEGLDIPLYNDVNFTTENAGNGYYILDNIPPRNINFNYPQQ